MANIEANYKAPTIEMAEALQQAFDFYNRELFSGRIPEALIILQHHKRYYGYYHEANIQSPAGDVGNIDEIAMNPDHFANRTIEEVLSTLVHEMVHARQHHFGAVTKTAHNKEWADMMREVGLEPSSTGAPGGKPTGRSVSHYIIEGGEFARVTAKLLATGFVLPWAARPPLSDEAKAKAKKKAESKSKYTCPACRANAWAKPGARLICGAEHDDGQPRVMVGPVVQTDAEPEADLDLDL